MNQFFNDFDVPARLDDQRACAREFGSEPGLGVCSGVSQLSLTTFAQSRLSTDSLKICSGSSCWSSCRLSYIVQVKLKRVELQFELQVELLVELQWVEL